MAINICFFEDEKFRNFLPLAYLRPVFALRAGITPLFRKAERYFGAVPTSLACRVKLSPLMAQQYREYPINIVKRGEGDLLLINGRIRDYGDLAAAVKEPRISTKFTNNEEIVAILLKNDVARELPSICSFSDVERVLKSKWEYLGSSNTLATLYCYCWEIMADIECEITADFKRLKTSFDPSRDARISEGAHIVNPSEVHCDQGVEICPGAVIDASSGPVYIGSNTKIEPHAAIYGPTYIGPNCLILAGKVSSSSIGHTSRVGGEVEQSVFQSYVNKYHAGFIGHSYVGSWVNFGAMTTNSDLKNNYSNIRVTLNGKSIDTGSNKVGSFIGDHTKFGIGTLLNTGINIGVCCNIFGGGLVADKEIASFSWGGSGSYDTYDVEKAMETAEAVARRRDCALPNAEIETLREIAGGQINTEGILTI